MKDVDETYLWSDETERIDWGKTWSPTPEESCTKKLCGPKEVSPAAERSQRAATAAAERSQRAATAAAERSQRAVGPTPSTQDSSAQRLPDYSLSPEKGPIEYPKVGHD